MHALYGTRGYRTFMTLLGLQACSFGALLLSGFALDKLAGSLLATGALALLVATMAGFFSHTWLILCEAAFCLRFLTWKDYLRRWMRPWLWAAAPVLLLGAGLLHAGCQLWLAALPLWLVAVAGLASSLLALAQVVLIARQLRQRDEVRQATLAHLVNRHGPLATQRLAYSLDYARGLIAANPFQMKRGVLLADLPGTAWHRRSEFAWAAAFEAAAQAIREEALNACFQRKLKDYQYPGAVEGDWNVFWLMRGAEPTPQARELCPETLRALQQVSGFPCMREAHFSVLQPHSRIRPHSDDANTWVTAHFGIQIPQECGIRVGRETRRWKEGEFLFFDTSFEHEAWNDSDTPRVVLLFDFIHPGLNEVEREFVMQMQASLNLPAAATVPAPALA